MRYIARTRTAEDLETYAAGIGIPVTMTGPALEGNPPTAADIAGEVGPVEVVEVLLIQGSRRRRTGVVTAASARYREHPEVPLTDAALDESLARCGFERALFGGRWASGQVRVIRLGPRL